MINYAIPGVYSHHLLNFKLLELFQNKPEYFHPNIKIEAVYGVFPFCIFDGGRIFNQLEQCTIEQVTDITRTYNNFGVSVRLVYTNSQLKPEHYKNHFGNIVLQACESNMNQIVTADNNFQLYIKENYPKYAHISSTTKCLNKEEFQLELKQDDYIEVCLDYNLNKNFTLLESLSPEEKEKCEFLCNAICPPGCPTRKHHYKLNSLHQLSYGRNYTVPYCGIKDSNVSFSARNYKNNISYQEIVEKYEPMGFKHFKLEGRTLSTINQALIYAEYMVKEEFKDEFLLSILK